MLTDIDCAPPQGLNGPWFFPQEHFRKVKEEDRWGQPSNIYRTLPHKYVDTSSADTHIDCKDIVPASSSSPQRAAWLPTDITGYSTAFLFFPRLIIVLLLFHLLVGALNRNTPAGTGVHLVRSLCSFHYKIVLVVR